MGEISVKSQLTVKQQCSSLSLSKSLMTGLI